MLKPNNNWQWYFNPQENSLLLDLGNGYEFCVGLAIKSLVESAKGRAPFSVEDAAIYQRYCETLESIYIDDGRAAEVALNAIAAARFHKPVMPKSWFFHAQAQDYSPQQGEVVVLANTHGEGRYLVIENCGRASLCMCLEPEMKLSEGKSLGFCGTIKVMNDRIMAHYEQTNSLSLVG
ncbi:Cell division protein ZapC [Vibrio stylophorae]|uniref:Cell division protein ZapC n=1 Tax=Vibrio stylophorae TaxID=659351 RepID=A0ABM8ZT47_9VIBR|nr:cell division protein ZapC [Vibrio stylophorae]CAH0533473.1 Cell division protein ZapC [Vibrio stylophorae]